MQEAAVDDRAAAVGIGAGQRQGADAALHEGARARDVAGVGGVRCLVDRQLAVAQGDRATGPRQRADCLGVAVQVEGAAIDDEPAEACERGASRQPQGATLDRCAAFVTLAGVEGDCTAAALGDRADIVDDAGEGTIRVLVEDNLRLVVDGPAQGRGVALQDTGENHRCAGVGARAHQLECARTRLGQSAPAAQRALQRSRAGVDANRIAAAEALRVVSENEIGVGQQGAALNPQGCCGRTEGSIVRHLQGALADHRLGGVGVRALQHERARPLLHQVSRAADRAAMGHGHAVVDLETATVQQGRRARCREARRRPQEATFNGEDATRAAQSRVARYGQRAATDRGATGVGVRAAKRQRAVAGLDQPATAIDRAAECGVGRLPHLQEGTVHEHTAAGTRQVADDQILAVEVEGAARHRQGTSREERTASTHLQGATAHGRSA